MNIFIHIYFVYICIYVYIKFSPEDILIDVKERRREGEREGEKHQCERETLINCLLHAPQAVG